MSTSNNMMKFETALQYMDPLQVTDYLHKTLDFLKRNNTELCFPNISQYTESFLVNLVTDTRNLKCKSLSNEDRRLADEIIEILELFRDVFQWAYSYENGSANRILLVYKKIYTNKVKNRKKNTIKPSSIAHRLIQPQTNPQTNTQQPDTLLSTSFKLSFLNKTLRFIKNGDEVTLYYNEMPLSNAEYIQSLMQTPGGGNEVGFGFKSLYAPLWEAMEEQSVNFLLKMTLQATNEPGIASLKLEKIPRKSDNVPIKQKEMPESTGHHFKNVDDTQKDGASRRTRTRRKKDDSKQTLDNSIDTTTPLRSAFELDPISELLNQVSPGFVKDTIISLAQFATEPSRASISFNGLSEHELNFVRKVKGWAASAQDRNKFTASYRELLVILNTNITHALKTCKITTTNESDGGITLKKSPLFAAPAPVKKSPVSAGKRSQSLVSVKSQKSPRDRSLSKDRLIEFQTASPTAIDAAKDNTTKTSSSNKENMPQARGRSAERRGLNKRTAKLLEDMSTPVESDRGIRMMLLMGWDGGALGSRGEGIIEPIIPAVDLPPKAGLGHVPRPRAHQRRPVEFRMTFFHNIYDLLIHDEVKKEILYVEPLTKREKNFIPAAVQCLNARRPAGQWAVEAELQRLVLQELNNRPNLGLRAEMSQDFKKVTLIKIENGVPWKRTATPTPKPIKPEKQRNKAVEAITDKDPDILITSRDINTEAQCVDARSFPPGSTKAIRKRAIRILFLKRIKEALQRETEEVRFKSNESIPNNIIALVHGVVRSLGGARLPANNLFGVEHQLYEELRLLAKPWQLSVVFKEDRLNFMLTKRRLPKKENITSIAEHKLQENNNDEMTDRNKAANVIKDNVQKGNTKESNDINKVAKDTGRDRLTAALVNKVFIIDNSKNISQNNKLNENILTEKCVNIDKHTTNTEHTAINVKNLARIQNENLIKSSDVVVEEVRGKMQTEYDSVAPSNKESDKQELEVFTDNILVLDNAGLSDLDKDIQDLEMAISHADLAFNVKNEVDYDHSDLESTFNTDPGCDVKKEGTDSSSDFEDALCFNVNENCIVTSPSNKRSRTNLNSSQELDPKRSKISIDDSEIVVIISPKDPNHKLNRANIIDIQIVISNEIDKCGKFLPLLKCHCVQNGALVYSCHDYDDVAWLENVVSVANLDLKVDFPDDPCLYKNNRCMISMKINSFLYLDAMKTLSCLERYNVGLDTKLWKVLSTHTASKSMANTFYFFIFEVDEKSLKYISGEKFSLYCGNDKAEFSIIQ